MPVGAMCFTSSAGVAVVGSSFQKPKQCFLTRVTTRRFFSFFFFFALGKWANGQSVWDSQHQKGSGSWRMRRTLQKQARACSRTGNEW